MANNNGVPAQDLKVGDCLGGFNLERVEVIPELRSTAYQFFHAKSGARLIHLYNDDPDNLFSVAFRTPVSDSTGVPHILEHSVLCGSKKFPVKDPFQEMLKGSLQTFLNALTYPDKTVYPVSSQVEKDFYNLVDVYCDAVLNPLLTENTFYQEGWHYDLENPGGTIGIKGIVYNEMKGVFSDFSNHVGRGTISRLFPDTTYFYESGGDPEHIPDLTCEQFREFHRKYYHPSNSFIFLYGNLPSEKTLNFINDRYLANFDRLTVDSSVRPQVLWGEPRTAVIEAPAPEEDDGSASVICTWIFGGGADAVSAFAGSILAHYFLATESSPLKRALVDSGLGEDLDDMCGFDAELAQSVFSVGLRKSKPEHAQAVLNVVMDTLEKEAANGLDGELIEGAVRQAEFHLREITGGHFPYNLRLADRCYRPWLNGGDPFALLAFEKPLSIIKEEMKKGGFFENVIRKNLIDNKHRLTSVVTASSEMGGKLEAQTEEQAARLTSGFTDDDRRRCAELTNTLRERQSAPPAPEALASLPTLNKNDLPKEGVKVPFEKGVLCGAPLIAHPIFTSGIAYLDVGFDFCGVDEGLIPFIPSYLEMLTRCGAGKYSYEQMAKRISLSTGGIDASATCRTKIGTPDGLFFMAFVHGKALEPRFGEMLGILEDLLAAPDLKNVKQIKDMLIEGRNALNSSVIQSGHSLAVTNASARLSESRRVDEIIGGITQLRFLDALVKNEDYGAAVEAFVKLHDFLINRNACVMSITAGAPSKFVGQLEPFVGGLPVKVRAGEGYCNNHIGNVNNDNEGYFGKHIGNVNKDNDGYHNKHIGNVNNSNNEYYNKHIGNVNNGNDGNYSNPIGIVGISNNGNHNNPIGEVGISNNGNHNNPIGIVGEVGKVGIEINSAVNFAARAWKVPGLSAADYGRLFLLSRNLSTGYLWDKIRVEGGAYGGMSGMSVSHPVFTCASYRDPNLEETLAHFTKGLREAAGLIPTEKVDQSIIGATGRIDHPKTPHSAGFGETMDILTGCTFGYRQEFREAVLSATPNDLKSAAERVLTSSESTVTVLGSAAAFDNAEQNGMVFEREKLLY